MIIAYIFHDFTQKICSEHFELLSFVFVVGFRCRFFFVRGSAHCIIYANLNFALDGTRGTLPLPFSQFFWNLVLWNSWSLLILRYGSFVIFYNVLFTMWSEPTQPPLIVLLKLGHMWEQLLWLTHIFGGKNFPQLWSFGQALKFHIRNILMNHLKRWNTPGYRSKEAPIIWQSHCQWPTSFGHLRPDFTAKPIARVSQPPSTASRCLSCGQLSAYRLRRLRSTRFQKLQGFMAQSPLGMLHFFTLFSVLIRLQLSARATGNSYFRLRLCLSWMKIFAKRWLWNLLFAV